MKLFTNFKLKHKGLFKAINLDWREVAIELMNDLIEEQQSHFACKLENHDLKKQLAVYEAKEQLNQKGEYQND